MENKYMIDEKLLDSVAGGRTLPEDWEKLADSLALQYKKMYKGVNYEQACKMVEQYFNDPEDLELIFEYLKKYFDEDGKLI